MGDPRDFKYKVLEAEYKKIVILIHLFFYHFKITVILY